MQMVDSSSDEEGSDQEEESDDDNKEDEEVGIILQPHLCLLLVTCIAHAHVGRC